jgi:anti-sigma factor RsiW
MRGLLAHRRMRRDVEAYLDGELAPEARARVARHLSTCWECSIAAETLRLLKRALSHRRDRTPASVAERRLRRFAEALVAGGQPGQAPHRQ